VVARGSAYLAWARALDRPDRIMPIERPAPTPTRAVRPAALSVTEIENWLRDPYTIYAKHILRIMPLEAVDTPPGAADRGIFIHGAIGEFTQRYAAALPEHPERELLALGERHFAPLRDYPEAMAFWWPRFLRIAHWLAGWDADRRAGVAALSAEIRGSIPIPAGGRTFTLRGVADRIERRADGSYAILDYKTGSPRTERQVRTGLSPQLTLEAAILRQGGFPDIAAGASVAEIAYVTLKGGRPPGEWKAIEFIEGTPDSQAQRALDKLTEIVRRFEDENEPYRSLVHPLWAARYGDYDHLARVREWSLTGGIDEDPLE
jgi:ATP-dependent helicase/nuclease subunit B